MRSIESFVESIVFLPIRRPGLLLLAVLAATALALTQLPALTIDSSMDTIFIEDDPERAVYEDFKKTFGEDEVVILSLHASGGDVFNPATLRRIDAITREIERLPDSAGVDHVVSLTNVYDVRGSEGTVEVNRFLDPIPDSPEALAALRERAVAHKLYLRNLVSKTADAAAINVFIDYRPGDRLYKEQLVQTVREIAARIPGPERVHVAGIPVLTVYTGEFLRRDMALYIPLTLAMMAFVLWLTFRSLWGVILPLASVGVATAWTFAIVRLMGNSISIVSSIVPSLLIAIGTSYGIHVLAAYHRHAHLEPTQRLRQALRHVLFPIFLCGFTTVIGFASLMTNAVTQLREFGIYASIGIVAAMLLAMIAIPAALHYVQPRSHGTDPEEEPVDGPPEPSASAAPAPASWADRLVMASTRFSARHARGALGFTALAIALCVWGIAKIEADTDYAANFKPDSAPVQALRFMRDHLSGERPITVVLRAKKPGVNAALEPEVLKSAERVEEILKSHPLVSSARSVSGYLKMVNQAMFENRPEAWALPSSANLASQYLDIFGKPEQIRPLLSSDRQALAIFGRSSIISSREFLDFMTELRGRLKRELGDPVEATVTGSMYLLSKSSMSIAIGQVTSLGSAALLIFLTVFALYRSFKFGMIAMIPNILPIVLAFALMGALGITLNIGTSIMASMVLGIAMDDTLHLLNRYRTARRRRDTAESLRATFQSLGRPIFFSSATNAAGFLVLMLSSFAPLYALGWLTVVTIVANLYGDLVVVPALLTLFDRSRAGQAGATAPVADAGEAQAASAPGAGGV